MSMKCCSAVLAILHLSPSPVHSLLLSALLCARKADFFRKQLPCPLATRILIAWASEGPSRRWMGYQKGERRSSPLFWLLWLHPPCLPLSAALAPTCPCGVSSPPASVGLGVLRLPIPAVAISENLNVPCQFPFKKIVNYIGHSILYQGQVYSMVIRHI